MGDSISHSCSIMRLFLLSDLIVWIVVGICSCVWQEFSYNYTVFLPERPVAPADDREKSKMFTFQTAFLHFRFLCLHDFAVQGQTKLADHLSRSSYGSISSINSQDVVDGSQSGDGGPVFRRSDSLISENDEEDNEILRECYREEMSEKLERSKRQSQRGSAQRKQD